MINVEGRVEWSDERHAENIVNEFIRRGLLPESEVEAVTARIADGEPLQALRTALQHTRPRPVLVRR